MRILLIGGSKSGKSRLAQELAHALARGGPMYYWAAMEPADDEDERRIRAHVEERRGWGFTTVEQGRDLTAVLARVAPEGAVLFDSVTAALANEMFGAQMDESAPRRVLASLREIVGAVRHFVCVCDDLWRDGMRYGAPTQAYCHGLAEICRALAADFDAVCEATAGLPHMWKGELPL